MVLCWKDLKIPSAVAAAVSMSNSFVQVLMQIAVWTTFKNAKEMLQMPIFVLYIPVMVLDLLLIVTGALLLVAVEKVDRKGSSGRILILPWMSLSVLYMLYETGINMYLFRVSEDVLRSLNGYMAKEDDRLPKVNLMSGFVVYVVYWAIKVVFHLGGLLYVMSWYRKLNEGKKNEEADITGCSPFELKWFNEVNYPHLSNPRYKSSAFMNIPDVVQKQTVADWNDAAEIPDLRVADLERYGARSQPVYGYIPYQHYDNEPKYQHWKPPNPYVDRQWNPCETNWVY